MFLYDGMAAISLVILEELLPSSSGSGTGSHAGLQSCALKLAPARPQPSHRIAHGGQLVRSTNSDFGLQSFSLWIFVLARWTFVLGVFGVAS